MIIAGETSGDIHGAALVKAMKETDDSISFIGIGGEYLKKEGVDIIMDAAKLAVIGVTEIFSKIFDIIDGISKTKKVLKNKKPSLVILIDFPGFNLIIAKAAKKLNIPTLYYISPKIWAWGGWRIKKIKKFIDHTAVIFPFEEEFYKKHNVPATYVGNPLMNSKINIEREKSDENIYIGLLPGSRKGEIKRLFPVMLEAARLISVKNKNIKFILGIASGIEKEEITNMMSLYENLPDIEIVSTSVPVFRKSRFVIAASGTVTLEAALIGIPSIIIYKVSALTYLIGSALIKIKHISLVNIIANKEALPELIQKKANPYAVFKEAEKLLGDKKRFEELKKELSDIDKLLKSGNVSENVAKIAFSMIKSVES